MLEFRYFVIKVKDFVAADLTMEEITAFNSVLQKINDSRTSREKGILNGVFIEDDWIIYPQVRSILESYVKQQTCNHEWEWYQIAGEGKICKHCFIRNFNCDD